MDYVVYVFQFLVSYVGGCLLQEDSSVDMLWLDFRDIFFFILCMEFLSLENVLEFCVYVFIYVVKDFFIVRYQGLQFVYLFFVYFNDYICFIYMEMDNKCFYCEFLLYLERFGFYKYMKMDKEEGDEDEEEEVQC